MAQHRQDYEAAAAQALSEAASWQGDVTSAVRVRRDGDYRAFTRETRWPLLVFVLLGCYMALVFGTPLLPGHVFWYRAWSAVDAVVTALLVVRFVRAAVIVDGSRLVVRSLLWTWSGSADQVEWFLPPASYGARVFKAGLLVKLSDERGTRIRSFALFGAGPYDGENLGVAEARELNAWLLAQKGLRPRLSPSRREPKRRQVWAARVAMVIATVLALWWFITLVVSLVDPLAMNVSR